MTKLKRTMEAYHNGSSMLYSLIVTNTNRAGKTRTIRLKCSTLEEVLRARRNDMDLMALLYSAVKDDE